jgi:hypothetical protein
MVFWFLAVLVSLVLAMAHITRLNSANDHRNRLWVSLVTIEEAHRALSDMEAGNRGFLLAGDQELREPFTRGRDIFVSRYQALLAITANDSMQQERLKAIKAYLTQWFSLYNPLIQKRRRSDTGRSETRRSETGPATRTRNGVDSRKNPLPSGVAEPTGSGSSEGLGLSAGSRLSAEEQVVLRKCNSLLNDIRFLLDEMRTLQEKRMAVGDYPTS